jgi:hypothetical protein
MRFTKFLVLIPDIPRPNNCVQVSLEFDDGENFHVQNPRYNFWSHGFTRCAPEIEKLFESVARSCMGPPLKPSEDDLSSGLAAEGIKV